MLNLQTEKDVFDLVLWGFQAASLLVFGALLAVGSPYGSQTTYSGMFTIDGKVAWIVMELVSPLAFALSYFARSPPFSGDSRSSGSGSSRRTLATHVFMALWMIHYTNRAVIYPLRQQSRKQMHLGILLSACVFNVVNGYVNARWLVVFSDISLYSSSMSDSKMAYFSRHPVRCVLGLSMFALGMAGNIHHDNILSSLRTRSPRQTAKGDKKSTYSVPYGGLFAFVSCPHFLCEIVEWTGFAILTQSPAAWTFVLSIVCNLLPRALCIDRWYKQEFAEYPRSRRALIPFII
ncbi:hypothetical protein GGI12_003842 [Dipsacomyces acuminosporus]|nr:hypothetical protein GGI12_003842 [Dipsacomyces acuminosporus]